jgi:ABC-type multidrug transport system ATPase subunit
MLSVRSVGKRFGGRWVLDDVSFDCAAGAVTVIGGPNGAGKSTLLRIVAGVIEPDRGQVEIDGQSIVGRPVAARRRLGYAPEAADPPGALRVGELLALVAALKRSPPLAPALRERLGVERIERQRIEQLSLGERRRACLAAALIGEPAVLVLDEPSNGLDDGGLPALIEVIGARRAAGAAVVVASHDPRLVQAVAGVRLRLEAGRLGEDGDQV